MVFVYYLQVRGQLSLSSGSVLTFGLVHYALSEFELMAEELLMSDSVIKVSLSSSQCTFSCLNFFYSLTFLSYGNIGKFITRICQHILCNFWMLVSVARVFYHSCENTIESLFIPAE